MTFPIRYSTWNFNFIVVCLKLEGRLAYKTWKEYRDIKPWENSCIEKEKGL